ncbi:anti-sigma regulatory factor, partial [Streptomyces sp. MBRL 10]
AGDAAAGGGAAADSDVDTEDEMGLAVISGLVDDLEVTSGESGGTIRMSWPVSGSSDLP